VDISGNTQYRVETQFFEITNIKATDGTPLYYVHRLTQSNPQNVTVIDLSGNVIASNSKIVGNLFYHSMDGTAYRIRYVDTNGFVRTQMLMYNLVMNWAPYAPSATSYVMTGPYITLTGTTIYSIRFTENNGYLVLPPYNSPSNTPWYPRVRFAMKPVAPEWARQVFIPQRPNMLAAWVPAKILDKSLIELDRKKVFFDPQHLPDLIIFDKDYKVKYALEGTAVGQPRRRGTLYNWKRGLIKQDIDAYKARLELMVELDPTDICYGFYSYVEPDVIYRGLDCNPFTNSNVRNKVIQFYYKNVTADSASITAGADPFTFIYHQILDLQGNAIAGQTNDPAPNNGAKTIFSTIAVGASINPQQFTVTDVRSQRWRIKFLLAINTRGSKFLGPWLLRWKALSNKWRIDSLFA
jgi:hypothetical protein